RGADRGDVAARAAADHQDARAQGFGHRSAPTEFCWDQSDGDCFASLAMTAKNRIVIARSAATKQSP
ncbi:MAG TPA: hypothetical protein VEK82_08740, partial [Stellaceae bacterium]|nr:hypothetical protein [Stellaceae bacterium]